MEGEANGSAEDLIPRFDVAILGGLLSGDQDGSGGFQNFQSVRDRIKQSDVVFHALHLLSPAS